MLSGYWLSLLVSERVHIQLLSLDQLLLTAATGQSVIGSTFGAIRVHSG